MTKAAYREYLKSKHWIEFRTAVLSRRGKCERCGLSMGSCRFLYDGSGLQLHHLGYRNLGRETPADVLVLCPGCHESEEQYKSERSGCLDRQIFKGWPEKRVNCPYCGDEIVIGIPCAPRNGGMYQVLPPVVLGSCFCEGIESLDEYGEVDSFICNHAGRWTQEAR